MRGVGVVVTVSVGGPGAVPFAGEFGGGDGGCREEDDGEKGRQEGYGEGGESEEWSASS